MKFLKKHRLPIAFTTIAAVVGVAVYLLTRGPSPDSPEYWLDKAAVEIADMPAGKVKDSALVMLAEGYADADLLPEALSLYDWPGNRNICLRWFDNARRWLGFRAPQNATAGLPDEVLCAAAMAYARRGNFKTARAFVSQMKLKWLGDPVVHEIAEGYVKAGNFSSAENFARDWGGSLESRSDILKLIAVAQAKAGRVVAARATAAKAGKLYFGNLPINSVLLSVTRALAEEGRLADAKRIARDTPYCWQAIAEHLLEAGNLDDAAAAIGKIPREGISIMYWWRYAYLKSLKGEAEEALATIEKASTGKLSSEFVRSDGYSYVVWGLAERGSIDKARSLLKDRCRSMIASDAAFALAKYYLRQKDCAAVRDIAERIRPEFVRARIYLWLAEASFGNGDIANYRSYIDEGIFCVDMDFINGTSILKLQVDLKDLAGAVDTAEKLRDLLAGSKSRGRLNPLDYFELVSSRFVLKFGDYSMFESILPKVSADERVAIYLGIAEGLRKRKNGTETDADEISEVKSNVIEFSLDNF